MEELTYEPNSGARALAGRRTQVVGLVVPFMGPDVSSVAAVHRDHRQLGPGPRPRGSARDRGRGFRGSAAPRRAGTVRRDHHDGHQAQDERVPVAAALSVPVVLVGVPDRPGRAALRRPRLRGGGPDGRRRAGGHGARRDRRASVTRPRRWSVGLNYVGRVLRSVRQRADERGLPLDRDRTGRGGPRPARRWPIRPARPGTGGRLGVWCRTPTRWPLLNALRQAGCRAGRDISFIGVSTGPAAEESDPPFTNVSEEPRDVSRRAMETLFWLLDPGPGRGSAGRPGRATAHPADDRDAPARIPRTLIVMPAATNGRSRIAVDTHRRRARTNHGRYASTRRE